MNIATWVYDIADCRGHDANCALGEKNEGAAILCRLFICMGRLIKKIK